MATKKEIKKQDESPVVAEMPAFMQNLDQNTSRGSEDVGVDDITIPRLEVVQSLSACRKKSDPSFIEGISEGDLYNNITRENYGGSVTLVPVKFMKEWLIWKDQDKGGGFGGAYPTQDAALHELERRIAGGEIPESERSFWEVVDTPQHFCLLVREDGSVEEIVVSLAKSKAKVSRQWNSMMRMNGGDTFTRAYVMSGVEAQNQQGQDYYNVGIRNAGFVTEPVYNAGLEMYESIVSGAKQASREYDAPVDQDANAEM